MNPSEQKMAGSGTQPERTHAGSSLTVEAGGTPWRDPDGHTDSTATTRSNAAGVSASRQAGRGSGPWWLGVAVALAVAVPLSWLLALAVNLPFFLGLFFFALFGLIIGAACFRVSHKHQPYPRNTVLAGTALIILATWGGAICFEAQSFGQAMAAEAVAAGGLNLKGTTIFEYRARVRGEVQGYLAERYPPGGTLGYVRWAAVSGEIPEGMLASVKKGLRTNQRGWWWIGRVAISIMLLAFGVGSQVLALRAPR